MAITELKREPVPAVIEELEAALERAKAGELTDVYIIGSLAGGDAFTAFSTTDVFKLVAHFELAKFNLLSAAPRVPNK